ncbi:fungal specific transcription factor [Phlyctema vagabunda]|uniref:Fungal specific transcription factor n=1 Tax=Phlyctema vagabunda TaxID=108571 RepID=A0ABR4P6L5_9HELO
MADLGKKILKEMDRVVSVVAGSGQGRSRRDSGTSIHAHEPIAEDNVPSIVHPIQVGASSNPADTSHPEVLPMPDFDPSLFDSVSNLDIFGLFDPGFDLVGVDACLEGNLDPYMACQNRQTDFFGPHRDHDWNRPPDW